MCGSTVLATEVTTNVLFLFDSDRGLGKCVDPLSRRQRIGETCGSSVTATEDYDYRGSLSRPLSWRQRIGEMIEPCVTTNEDW